MKDEFADLVRSTKLTLAETFDMQLKVPKDFKELYEFHKKEFPHLQVATPTPAIEIAILSFNELPHQQTFLAMLARALQLRFQMTAKVMGNSGWEQAKWVIAPDYGISSDPALSKRFREGDKPGHNFLGNIPLFLLNDLALYIREPKLKSSLWKALCQEIESSLKSS